MKRAVLYILLLPWLIHVANAQNKLILDGVVKGYSGHVKLIINDITMDHDADMDNEEVIYMVDGRFRIERELSEPTLLSIRIRPEITENFDPGSWEAAFIWVDHTNLTLQGEKGTFEYCDVTGYSRQDDNENSKIYVRKKVNEYRLKMDSLSSLTSQSAREELREMKSVSGVYLGNKYRLDHCYLNPHTFVSVYNYSWFVKWIPEMVPKSNAIEFYNRLEDSLKNSIPGKQIKNYIDHIAVNRRLSVGDRPYDFSLPDSCGSQISLSSYRGQVILLDFWSAGCGPCRREHTNYVDLYDQYADRGFEIISVSQDRRREPWHRAMSKDRMTWTSLWDEEMQISKYTYLVTSIPDNYLIDRDGIIIAKDLMGEELRKTLGELFNE